LTTKSTKFEFWIQDTWSRARRPKSQRKADEGYLEGEAAKPTSGMKSGKTKERAKKSSKSTLLKQTPPKPSQCKLSPLDRHYHISSLNHLVSKSSTNFVHNLSPFGNELIKHKPREEWDAMYHIKIRVLHKIYMQVFKQLYTIIMPRVNPHKETTIR
jgi:hypothetical protein